MQAFYRLTESDAEEVAASAPTDSSAASDHSRFTAQRCWTSLQSISISVVRSCVIVECAVYSEVG